MAVRTVLVHIRVISVLLWLTSSLSVCFHSQARSSQHFSSPEVVMPLKVTGRGRSPGAPGWLSYSLRFGGQKHIIHIKVKSILVSRHFPVFTYTDQHALREDQPFIQDDCYFHGYVEGDHESLVALSSCLGGFQGVLQINGLTYEIKPMKHSSTFEHLVYNIDMNEATSPSMSCGLTDEEIAHQLELQETYNSTLKQSSFYGWWTHKRFVELGVVVDHNRFLYSHRNTTVIQQDVFTVVNFVNGIYKPLDVDVLLIGIEIWTKGNPPLSNNVDTALNQFKDWKHANLNLRMPSDITHLYINDSYGTNIGAAFQKGICSKLYNLAVISFLGNEFYDLSIIISHELGHSLGMGHDTQWCNCGARHCLMYHSKTKATPRFSNCSYAQFWNWSYTNGQCIYYPPLPNTVLKLNVCGNLLVEEGEECDCGTMYQCSRDPCCLPDCTLKPGAACAFGLCCKDCNFLHSGYLCRPQANECDLPEWCNGTYHQCPEDVYMMNGIPCNDSSYCFEKRCNSHDTQCKEIFGQNAKSAPQICYNRVNSQGDRFGHCGIKDESYIKCDIADRLCGRLQCENMSILPSLHQHSTLHQMQFKSTTCWGTDYHAGMPLPDNGLVKDGTDCGPHKICLKHKCISMSSLSRQCDPMTCNMRGVCNSKEHCHCDYGWAPPNCLLKGLGGSFDSGPPPPKSKLQVTFYLFLLLWLTPLSFLIIYAFHVLFMRNKKREKERGMATVEGIKTGGMETEAQKSKGVEKKESKRKSTVRQKR
ncbi:PREDICTED: disintegrin and metalloproteinase domain-containing protein 20-like [Elephantulus edwardii]|uniref:disintegrin and metalloproteinase domain-containing protein 20-like n=1 Tax=Elephantulus edwardii TaxID=28737 RepID=UPI0003F0582A|nr:PREDICTED: disintegrin and metalloproteinase domain-containing protein 20-like [Elephantulus edwardii]